MFCYNFASNLYVNLLYFWCKWTLYFFIWNQHLSKWIINSFFIWNPNQSKWSLKEFRFLSPHILCCFDPQCSKNLNPSYLRLYLDQGLGESKEKGRWSNGIQWLNRLIFFFLFLFASPNSRSKRSLCFDISFKICSQWCFNCAFEHELQHGSILNPVNLVTCFWVGFKCHVGWSWLQTLSSTPF